MKGYSLPLRLIVGFVALLLIFFALSDGVVTGEDLVPMAAAVLLMCFAR